MEEYCVTCLLDGVGLGKQCGLDLLSAIAFGLGWCIAIFATRAITRRALWLIALRATVFVFAIALRLRLVALGMAVFVFATLGACLR